MAKKVTQTKRNDALIEAGKEMLRVSLMAMVAVTLLQLENGGFDYKMIILSGIVAGLRGLDKFLHTLGKSTDNKSMEGGLTRF